jgi:biotin carboxyl carrier protein
MYQVKVNGKTFEITENGQEYALNGEPVDWDFSALSANRFSILLNNQSFNAELIKKDVETKTFTVKVNENIYEIEIADKYDRLLHQLGFDNISTHKVNDIHAPMPGMVLSLLVEPGQEIKKNDPVIVLEAMKMENVLKSAGDGKIKQIKVTVGEAVEKGQILIELE